MNAVRVEYDWFSGWLLAQNHSSFANCCCVADVETRPVRNVCACIGGYLVGVGWAIRYNPPSTARAQIRHDCPNRGQTLHSCSAENNIWTGSVFCFQSRVRDQPCGGCAATMSTAVGWVDTYGSSETMDSNYLYQGALIHLETLHSHLHPHV